MAVMLDLLVKSRKVESIGEVVFVDFAEVFVAFRRNELRRKQCQRYLHKIFLNIYRTETLCKGYPVRNRSGLQGGFTRSTYKTIRGKGDNILSGRASGSEFWKTDLLDMLVDFRNQSSKTVDE